MWVRPEVEAAQAHLSPPEWKEGGLEALIEKRDRFSEYGLKGFFPRSIKRLQDLTGELLRRNNKGHQKSPRKAAQRRQGPLPLLRRNLMKYTFHSMMRR